MAWSPRRAPVERMVSMPTRPKPAAVGSAKGNVYGLSPRGVHQPLLACCVLVSGT
eukprot:symbB.v1.2.040328.t1/scaffold7148.1/size13028/2